MGAPGSATKVAEIISIWQPTLDYITQKEREEADRIIARYGGVDCPACREALHRNRMAWLPAREGIIKQICDVTALIPMPPMFLENPVLLPGEVLRQWKQGA